MEGTKTIYSLRFTERVWWHYVESSLMIVDLGTRRGVTLKQVDQNSDWKNGYSWMGGLISDFPITPVSDLYKSSKGKGQLSKGAYHTIPSRIRV